MTTLKDALDKFILLKSASLRSEETIKWYKSLIGACIKTLGVNRDIETVIEDDLLHYINDELRNRDTRYPDEKQKPAQVGGLSRDSIRSHIRALKAFWRWCAKRYDIKDPMDSVQVPKKTAPKVKSITPENFVKLFDSTISSKYPERDRALLALMADTGARRAGIVGLKVSDVEKFNMRAKVIEKGLQERWVYWTYYTDKLIRQWIIARDAQNDALWINANNGEPLQASAINQILKRLKKRAGVKGRTNPHSFRHNFARMYLQSGGRLPNLAQLLGHKDVNVTSAYYAVFSSDELAVMQAEHSPLLKMLKE